ncbi:MAG TPA: malate dehydrogenase [Geobacteraceae bacterium]|nr:malate dehydrogenase [Geobacteraceae bacterium]
MSKKKIALIGGGQIGGVIMQLAAVRELGDIVMYDIVEGVPQGKVLDMLEVASVSARDFSLLGTNNYEEIKGSDLVIVTAGLARKPGMSRDDLITTNSKIMRSVATAIKEFAPDAYVIVISNPLDVMVTLCHKVTGFPKNRVMGMAGVLDSARFATFVAMELGVSARDVHALVMGGHGDDMVPLTRFANVNGIPVMYLLEKKHGITRAKEVMADIVKRTRYAGGEIVGLLKTGSAFYSPATAAMAMAEAILKDQKRVFPVCALLEGEYGVNGYFAGVPCVIGSGGVERIIELELDPEEKSMFEESVSHVKTLVDNLPL